MSAVAERHPLPEVAPGGNLSTKEDIRRLIDERIAPDHVVGDVSWCDDKNEWRALVASDAGRLLLMAFRITLRGHRN